MLVAGVDSSTQSTKVVLCRAEDGQVVGLGSAQHPAGTECDPQAWWTALQQAGDGLLTRAAAVGVAGQQHGMIVLDDAGRVIGRRCSGMTCARRVRQPPWSASRAALNGGRTIPEACRPHRSR